MRLRDYGLRVGAVHGAFCGSSFPLNMAASQVSTIISNAGIWSSRTAVSARMVNPLECWMSDCSESVGRQCVGRDHRLYRLDLLLASLRGRTDCPPDDHGAQRERQTRSDNHHAAQCAFPACRTAAS